jgi:hypothetical protein
MDPECVAQAVDIDTRIVTRLLSFLNQEEAFDYFLTLKAVSQNLPLSLVLEIVETFVNKGKIDELIPALSELQEGHPQEMQPHSRGDDPPQSKFHTNYNAEVTESQANEASRVRSVESQIRDGKYDFSGVPQERAEVSSHIPQYHFDDEPPESFEEVSAESQVEIDIKETLAAVGHSHTPSVHVAQKAVNNDECYCFESAPTKEELDNPRTEYDQPHYSFEDDHNDANSLLQYFARKHL